MDYAIVYGSLLTFETFLMALVFIKTNAIVELKAGVMKRCPVFCMKQKDGKYRKKVPKIYNDGVGAFENKNNGYDIYFHNSVEDTGPTKEVICLEGKSTAIPLNAMRYAKELHKKFPTYTQVEMAIALDYITKTRGVDLTNLDKRYNYIGKNGKKQSIRGIELLKRELEKQDVNRWGLTDGVIREAINKIHDVDKDTINMFELFRSYMKHNACVAKMDGWVTAAVNAEKNAKLFGLGRKGLEIGALVAGLVALGIFMKLVADAGGLGEFFGTLGGAGKVVATTAVNSGSSITV